MKKFLVSALATALIVIPMKAQDPEFQYYKSKEIKTLLGRDRSGGGYGSFSIGYSLIDDHHAVTIGGRIAWIASHYIGIGFGGTGFINEFHFEPSINREVFLTGGYGGLYIEPILFPRFPVHLSFPVLLGGGGVSYISNDETFNSNFVEDSQPFLLVEPSAEIELNLTKNFRMAVGATYRLPTPFDIGLSGTPMVSAESLKGLSYQVTFKFGKF